MSFSFKRCTWSFFLNLSLSCVLSMESAWHQLIDFIICFLNLQSQDFFHFWRVLVFANLILRSKTIDFIDWKIVCDLFNRRWSLKCFLSSLLKILNLRLWLGNKRFYCKWNNWSSYLNSFCHFRFKFNLFFC